MNMMLISHTRSTIKDTISQRVLLTVLNGCQSLLDKLGTPVLRTVDYYMVQMWQMWQIGFADVI